MYKSRLIIYILPCSDSRVLCKNNHFMLRIHNLQSAAVLDSGAAVAVIGVAPVAARSDDTLDASKRNLSSRFRGVRNSDSF